MKTIEDIRLEAAVSAKIIAFTQDVVNNLGGFSSSDITDMSEALAMQIINLVKEAK